MSYGWAMHGPARAAMAGAALWAVTGLAGCGSVARIAPRATTVVVSEADRGRSVNVHAGDRVQVVLHSTYWQVAGSSDPAVLRETGTTAVSPQPGCIPGGGCGTVTVVFDAVAPGRADLDASRTACGEALRCTGDAGSYRVTIVVAS